MNEIPSMWRTELLHPQFVHFTVALLMTGSLLWLLNFLFKSGKKQFLSNTGQLLVIIGTLITWVTVYTGEMADSEVGRSLCDPTVLESHEHNAYYLAWIFTVVSVLFLIKTFTKLFNRFRTWVYVLIGLFILGGNAYLAYTAHLGGKIVYQQGGGVYHPSENCSEFE